MLRERERDVLKGEKQRLIVESYDSKKNFSRDLSALKTAVQNRHDSLSHSAVLGETGRLQREGLTQAQLGAAAVDERAPKEKPNGGQFRSSRQRTFWN